MAAQLPDLIVIEGEKMKLYSNPLELYWMETNKRRPPFYTQPECQRGYIATWLIDHNRLYLIGIEGSVEKRYFLRGTKPKPFTLDLLFPRNKGQAVLATWFSGKLRIPVGRMTLYEHHGYDSRFEKELIATVSNGAVHKMVTLDYTQQSLVINFGLN